MTVPFWVLPRSVNCDPTFLRNSVPKQFLFQAESLVNIVVEPEFVLPESLKGEVENLN